MSSPLISLLLLLGAAGLMTWHLSSWRAAQKRPLAAVEFDFRRRQFRRRMQTSAMLALLAVALFAGELLIPKIHSRLFGICYWAGVLVALFWTCLMAVVDLLATHFHFSRLRQDSVVEQARLRTELRRLQSVEGNGHAKPPTDGEEQGDEGRGGN